MSEVAIPFGDPEPRVVEEAFAPPEAWQDTWQSWPESKRGDLQIIIEKGRLAPEVYKRLNFRVEEAVEDKRMNSRDPSSRNLAGEVDYNKNILRLFPEFSKFPPYWRAHIAAHEMAHFAATHLIDPVEYRKRLGSRPLDWNGRYIKNLAGSITEESSYEEYMKVLSEMIADDLGDFLRAQDADEMLLNRLKRLGSQSEIAAQYSRGELGELREHFEALFGFFSEMLDPERVAQLNGSFLERWFPDDDVMGVESYPVMPDVGEEYWQAPATKGPPRSNPDSPLSIIAEVLGVDLNA